MAAGKSMYWMETWCGGWTYRACGQIGLSGSVEVYLMRKLNVPLLSLILLLSVASFPVFAQRRVHSTAAPKPKVSDNTEQFRKDFINATEAYKVSLEALADTYDKNLKRLTEQNAPLKELFDQGLISKREYDQNGAAITEAKAKLDDIKQQLSQADTMLTVALRPPTPGVAPEFPVGPQGDSNWTTGNKKTDGLIKFYGEKYGVDPYLIYCVMHQESQFSSTAISPKGAQGLMQLMPATAARYGVANPYDVAQNIMGGTRYLKDLIGLFGNRIDLVLAGYNAGEGAVMKYGNRVPPYSETQNYVKRIGSRYYGDSLSKPTIKTVPSSSSKSLK
jgi:soluble lytic murein transglycosylase-like protein